MALNSSQKQKIDDLIGSNKKKSDILDQLVGQHGAKSRDVLKYLDENQTLQGVLNTITRRTKDVEAAGDVAKRKAAAREIKDLSQKAIKMLQHKSTD